MSSTAYGDLLICTVLSEMIFGHAIERKRDDAAARKESPPASGFFLLSVDCIVCVGELIGADNRESGDSL